MTSQHLPFKRTIASAFPVTDGDPATGLVVAHNSFRAMQEMVGALLEKGDGVSRETLEGIYFLFETQRLILAGIANEVSVWASERQARSTDDAPDEAMSDPVRKLREDFIASSAEAGAETRVIAAAVNMKRANVERVIRRLRGETSPSGPRVASA